MSGIPCGECVSVQKGGVGNRNEVHGAYWHVFSCCCEIGDFDWAIISSILSISFELIQNLF